MHTSNALWPHPFEKPCSSETHTMIPNYRHKHQTKVWGDRHIAVAVLLPAHSAVACLAPPRWLPRFETSFYTEWHTHLFCLLPVGTCTVPQGSAFVPLCSLNSPPSSEVRCTSVSSAITYVWELLRGFCGQWRRKASRLPLVLQFFAQASKCSTSEPQPQQEESLVGIRQWRLETCCCRPNLSTSLCYGLCSISVFLSSPHVSSGL